MTATNSPQPSEASSEHKTSQRATALKKTVTDITWLAFCEDRHPDVNKILTAFADTLEAVIAELPEKRYREMVASPMEAGFNSAIDQTRTVLQTLVEGLRNER